MLARLDSCVRRNDEGLSAAMEPKFWDFAENDAVFCIMRHPRRQESSQTGFLFARMSQNAKTHYHFARSRKIQFLVNKATSCKML